MEMKPLLLCAMMVAASLLASPATARDPFVEISVEDSERRTPAGGNGGNSGGGLECCNDCRCDRSWGWCTCKDSNSYDLGCIAGCGDCRCSLWPSMSCVCADMMRQCPDSCGMRQTTLHGTAASHAQANAAAAVTA